MQIWLGTSGYAYSEWVGGFYPRGTHSDGMLAFYATQFPLVELNFTHYRHPSPGDLERQLNKSPTGFQFLVKLHRAFTHDEDWSLVDGFRSAVEVLANAGRLMGLLCQYPQRFHRTPENEARLLMLAERFLGCGYAVEFRHRSWATPEVASWLGQRGITIVSVDAPPIDALFPTGLVQSTRTIYVRFHSRRASTWYASDKDRYDYDYSDAELNDWLDALAAREDAADRALLLFNNCRRSQAAQNAERVRQLLERMGLGDRVVPPFATQDPRPQQGLLF